MQCQQYREKQKNPGDSINPLPNNIYYIITKKSIEDTVQGDSRYNCSPQYQKSCRVSDKDLGMGNFFDVLLVGEKNVTFC